jgi:hypothetical protein
MFFDKKVKFLIEAYESNILDTGGRDTTTSTLDDKEAHTAIDDFVKSKNPDIYLQLIKFAHDRNNAIKNIKVFNKNIPAREFFNDDIQDRIKKEIFLNKKSSNYVPFPNWLDEDGNMVAYNLVKFRAMVDNEPEKYHIVKNNVISWIRVIGTFFQIKEASRVQNKDSKREIVYYFNKRQNRIRPYKPSILPDGLVTNQPFSGGGPYANSYQAIRPDGTDIPYADLIENRHKGIPLDKFKKILFSDRARKAFFAEDPSLFFDKPEDPVKPIKQSKPIKQEKPTKPIKKKK